MMKVGDLVFVSSKQIGIIVDDFDNAYYSNLPFSNNYFFVMVNGQIQIYYDWELIPVK